MNDDSTQGLRNLRLIPPPHDADVLDDLHDGIASGTRLRAAVAYTSGYDEVDIGLLASRTRNNGHLCVDIRKPTNLDWLLELHNAGGNVRLNLRKPLDGYGEPKLPEGLLHSKMLLIDRHDGHAEVWVGSHNWSRRALTGPNIETTLVTEARKGSHLYHQVESTLEWIANVCAPFDPALMDVYRRLQGEDTSDGEKGYLLRLYSEDVDSLDEEAVTVFGTNVDDLRQLPDVGNGLRVELTELGRRETKTLYEARVLHRGLLGGADGQAGGISFTARRYADRMGRRRARLHEKDELPEGVIDRSGYFATVQILGVAANLEAVTIEKPPTWMSTADDPLLARMRPHRRDRGQSKRPVQVAVPDLRVPDATLLGEREVIERGDEALVTRVAFRRGQGR